MIFSNSLILIIAMATTGLFAFFFTNVIYVIFITNNTAVFRTELFMLDKLNALEQSPDCVVVRTNNVFLEDRNLTRTSKTFACVREHPDLPVIEVNWAATHRNGEIK